MIKNSTINCPYLRRERAVLELIKYNKLAGKGFPSLLDICTTSQFNHSEVVMEKLGQSLLELIRNQPQSMNEASIFNIGFQLVNRIEILHNLGYCHGNISPSSIYFSGED